MPFTPPNVQATVFADPTDEPLLVAAYVDLTDQIDAIEYKKTGLEFRITNAQNRQTRAEADLASSQSEIDSLTTTLVGMAPSPTRTSLEDQLTKAEYKKFQATVTLRSSNADGAFLSATDYEMVTAQLSVLTQKKLALITQAGAKGWALPF